MKPTTRRRWLDAMLLVVAILFATFALWAYSQERHDLPPFDYERAKSLTPERRAMYERDLFNEVMYWNIGSPKYMERDGSGARRREADWLTMTRDGYELAYITLQVLQPPSGIRYSVKKPLARLTELADGGDAGAMCLYTYLIDRDPNGKEAKYIEPAYSYKRQGAQLGHPACLRDAGYFLMTGIHGFPKDVPAGLEAAIQAERAEYGGAVSIAVYLTQRPTNDADAWTRLYCWQSLASKYRVYSEFSTVIFKLRNPLQQPKNAEYFLLADRLEKWSPSLDECVALGLGMGDS
ncbi:hypothetical protein [Cupriavidus basilensis]|uniref:hypothetical protein n=1 Tax=Cupriavidus basilensis TaxID=68895 RepID=UPI00157AAB91|nr:hypothetical protein [Cupriavidus basilensis]NUA27134.1 hypothetical protein [Cupriavidus basilensis]